jgi:hypothetical protein
VPDPRLKLYPFSQEPVP